MIGERIRLARERLGLTQQQLAERAGVSRQLVGALEAGRHLPRVDAAMALAAALGLETERLFSSGSGVTDALTGAPAPEGALVRAGQVGDRQITSPARLGAVGWDVVDGIVRDGEIERWAHLPPGLVIAGCEPGLELLERLLRQAGLGALAVACSSAAAIEALNGSRVHAAVVHGLAAGFPAVPDDLEVARFHLCAWRVGLAGPRDAASDWIEVALHGDGPVVQREAGAGAQQAFQKAVGRPRSGPRAGGHLEAARLAVTSGLPAVTIEPAARAMQAAFHPLELHQAEVWIARRWQHEACVESGMAEITGEAFQKRLAAIGGYDLSGSGLPV